MTNTAILLPVFALLALTFGLIMFLGMSRIRAADRSDVRMKDIALNADAWPEDIRKISNCVSNQFQAPILFYLLCILLMITSTVRALQVALAWIFVTSRFVHARIHTGSNNVRHRFHAYLIGFAALLMMWIDFALDLLMKGL